MGGPADTEQLQATWPLTSAGATPTSSPIGALRLVVCQGPNAGTVASAHGTRAVIGRALGVELRLSDPMVSQFHAELSLVPEGIAVRDLDSKNGVHCNGVRIGRALLRPGSMISLGQSLIRLDVQSVNAPRVVPDTFGGLSGESAPMRELFALLIRLAECDLSVLIQGETGTGKEEAARALHKASSRQSSPFVVLDATALPEGLAASVLFGHERGAFTGATERRAGLFEAAHGGVLFIDEVGELPPALQAMLLRVLQSREVMPVGSNRPRPVDVRVLSATWRDLRTMVNQGSFREDLYYRLAQATLWMPSLSERSNDIPLLVRRFLLATVTTQPRALARDISQEALALLASRTYRGNVRELRSVVERLALLAEGPVIAPADLECEAVLSGLRVRQQSGPPAHAEPPAPQESQAPGLSLFRDAKQTAIADFERVYLMRLLARADGNLSRAAAFAGLERHNLRALLRKHGLYRQE